MTADLDKLSPAALSAAMRGGTDSWGAWGNSETHIRYVEPTKSRRLCLCGCRRRVTHIGMCNGVGLIWGCELRVRRWAKGGEERG